MARPLKRTVEYFPHMTKSGRTMYILESKYGNDGYAFWFKILELLSDSYGQVYDATDPANWEFMLAKTMVSGDKANEILTTLASVGAIDAELWKEHRVVWSQNLVDRLEPLYKRRNESQPQRPVFATENQTTDELLSTETPPNGVIVNRNPQRKGKESKGKDSKDSLVNPPFDFGRIIEIWNEEIKTPKVSKLTDDRKKKIKARIDDWHINDSEQIYVFARTIFKKIAISDFLSARKGDWQATFDWVFANDKNYVKVMEGNYDNHKGQESQEQPRNLGAGEYITQDGRRTYGTGKATIPMDASPRPSERYSWNAENNNWIIQ